MPATTTLHVTLSGDVFLKSRRTQKRLIKRVRANLDHAIRSAGYDGQTKRVGTHRFELDPSDACVDAVRSAALSVFGLSSVDTVRSIAFDGIENLARAVAEVTADQVDGHTFAARVQRRGTHEWNSMDLARLIGTELLERSAGVDLSNPEIEVHVTVLDQRAFLVTDHQKAAGGLPLGTQDHVLCLVSGGFDSVVAAWMLMARGCPVDFVHFSLNCAQSDHAIAVARELWSRWGHGTDPTVHLVEFQPVKDALLEHVDSRMRQVTLKVLMARAASEIAQDVGIAALVTGDALGQVSSQTLPHLVAVSRSTETPILRPLLGLPKEAIIDFARKVGTAELSARAQEFCDLSAGGPVATAATEIAIANTVERIPEEVLADVVVTRKVFDLKDWTPGQL
ncbi:MAG: tRNA 4-thiouridine(8) synthase ThiI [Acidimicrobiia bacterium]|nr:MAG: tRNA 4-thiouridine(8) synthase ThiI [Acidimicrobiia bacterium]